MPMTEVAAAESQPERVVTTPVEITILRIVLFPESATYRFVPSDEIAKGEKNLAASPVSSTAPLIPAVDPASVVTE